MFLKYFLLVSANRFFICSFHICYLYQSFEPSYLISEPANLIIVTNTKLELTLSPNYFNLSLCSFLVVFIFFALILLFFFNTQIPAYVKQASLYLTIIFGFTILLLDYENIHFCFVLIPLLFCIFVYNRYVVTKIIQIIISIN